MAIKVTSQHKAAAQKFVLEYLKCKNDFVYFCENYALIELPGGDVKLKLYKKQKELVLSILEEHYACVLKSRQVGISTITQILCAWLVVFHDNCVCGIVSKDGSEATIFARTIRGIVEKLPKWFGVRFDKYTEQSFILKNGSKVYASPVNPQAPNKCMRGKAITFLVIDEAAFIDRMDDAWTSMVPALSTAQMHARANGIPFGTLILSTPNKTVGSGAWFYQQYTHSLERTGIFKHHIIHWKDIIELAGDPNWYKTQCELFNNDQKKIQQELDLKFLSATGSFFDDDTSIKLQEDKQDPIQILKLRGGEFWVFEKPIPGCYYLIGVDTAPEHGEDKSTINIFEYRTMNQVGEFQGKCRIDDFIKIIISICFQYPGTIIVESNSYGNQVCESLSKNMDLYMRLYKEKRGEGEGAKFFNGLSTNSRTRPLMIDALHTYVTQFPETIKSTRFVMELIGLTEKSSGRVEADRGCHDDIVMAGALCYYVRKYDPPLSIDYAEGGEMGEEFTNGFTGVMDLNSDAPRLTGNLIGGLNDFHLDNYGKTKERKGHNVDLNWEAQKINDFFKDFYGQGDGRKKFM